MNDLDLYYLPTCPYCQKVLRFIKENDIPITLHNTSESGNRDFLQSHGGKNQVPCLFIDDTAMYESDDIITYLKERYVD